MTITESLRALVLGLALTASPALAETFDIAGVGDVETFNTYGAWTSAVPVNITFDLTGVSSIVSATLSILAFDIDTGDGEADSVFLWNIPLGDLAGADSQDSTTAFTLDPTAPLAGLINALSIYNTNATGEWGFQIKAATLTLDATRAVPGPIAGAGLASLIGLAGWGVLRRSRS